MNDCPPPLVTVSLPPDIPPTEQYRLNHRVCLDHQCCFPCIANKLIHKEGIFQALVYLNSISFFLMIILVVVLLVWPRQMMRTKYALGMAISLVFFHSPEVLQLFEPMEKTLCADETRLASARTNWRCALQGGLLIYGALSTSLWSATRIITLFCALKYRIVLSGNTETFIMIFICSILPLFQAGLGIGFNIVRYDIGHLCSARINAAGYLILWGPCIIILVPFLCMHFATFILIGKSLKRQNLAHSTQRAMNSLRSNCDGSDVEVEASAPKHDERGGAGPAHRNRLANLAARRPLAGLDTLVAFIKLEWRPFASFSVNLVSYCFRS